MPFPLRLPPYGGGRGERPLQDGNNNKRSKPEDKKVASITAKVFREKEGWIICC